jgi:pimeloyl-ACP methyl ester carboxylesterase
VYESEPGIQVPALLFVPKGSQGRKPAVVFVHGRGKAAGAGASGDVEQLIQAGFVVLSIDLRGMGETQVSSDGEDFSRYFGDYESAMTALLVGKPLVGMRAWDVQRGVDLLAGRSEVDPNKISAFGKDKGAVPVLYAALLDDRIKKLALEGMLISYHAVTSSRIHRQVFEDVIVGGLRSFDLPDLVATLSPRPVWIVNASDPLGHRADIKVVQTQYAGARTAFRLAGAEGALRIEQRLTGAPLASVYTDWMK